MKILAAIALGLIIAPALHAQHQTFTINPDTSEVKMQLKTNHEIVNGTFHLQSGTINFDRTAATISGNVNVAAITGKTGNDSRDKKMKKDILKTDKYTEVTFAPASYTGTINPTGDSTIEVSGAFTLLGAAHTIIIPMQIHIDHENGTAKSHFVIPYVQWGLKNPSFLMWRAEDNVAIDLNLIGTISH